MELRAIGKCIDTLPIANLFSQEEAMADTVVIKVDRFYNEMDLADFSFYMRGVTESGGEAQTILGMLVGREEIELQWYVGRAFTTEAGTLSLDMYACSWEKAPDTEENVPAHIIRYQLPPVQVRGLPESDTILESHSYTAFLLQVKEAANDAITAIEKIIAKFEAQLPNYDSQIARLKEAVAANTSAIEGITPVVTLTQSEFDALAEPLDGTLYVVKQDA